MLAGIVILFLAGSIIWMLGRVWNRPQASVAIPEDPGKLEPQLRAYIRNRIKWVLEQPNNFDRQTTLGIVYAANGLWAEAKTTFETATKLNASRPLPLLYIGVSTEALGDLPGAEEAYRKVTQKFPTFAPGFARLGDLLIREGKVAEAEPAFRRLTELAPKEWRGFAGLGDIEVRRGRYDEAMKWLNQALSLAPESKEAHHLLGLAYRGLGRMQEAETELRIGLNAIHYPMPDEWSAIAPQHCRLLQEQLELADKLSNGGQAAQAVRLLQEILPFQTNNVELIAHLGFAWHQAGDPQRAKALLLQTLQIEPRRLMSYVLLTSVCLSLGEREEGLADADKAVELGPKTAPAHLARSAALQELGRLPEAAAELQTAFECDPQNPAIQMDLGDLYYRKFHQTAEALAHYEKALAVDPAFADASFRIAEVKMLAGDVEGAKAALAQGRRFAPDHPALRELERRLRKVPPRAP